ncbi:MAG TPA: hypothetical protein VFA94_07980 [Acidimicrobiales bacterium]|nr:hypothetical protein [Acidimicrobiales bacterium]
MWHGADGMGWGMLLGSLVWVAFCGAAVYLLVTVVITVATGTRFDQGDDDVVPARDGPAHIARRRYASGEINRDEFLRLNRDLHQHDQAA